MLYFSVFLCVRVPGRAKHSSIHTLCEQNSVICTFPRYLPRKNTTIFENRPFLKRHGVVSVWVYVYFCSVNLGEKGPYTHTLTSPHQLFFDIFVTFSSKTPCLSAKLDTLTSKQIGVCPKNVVFLPVTKLFFAVFYGPKHIHSYTHLNSQIGFWIQIPFELRIVVCVWVYVFLVYECMGARPGGWGGTPATPKKPFFWPLSKTHAESGFWEPFRATFWIPAPKGPF